MKDLLLIIGAGGHGKVCADIALQMGYYGDIAFLDDNKTGYVMEIPVLGKTSDFGRWIEDADFFVAIGNSQAREKTLNLLNTNQIQMTAVV